MDDELNEDFTEEELINRKIMEAEANYEILKDKMLEEKDNECNNN